MEKSGNAISPLPVTDNSFQVKTPTNKTYENNADEGMSASKDSSFGFSVHRVSDSGGSGSSNSDRKRRLSFSLSPSNDTEKVSVVRAAGTFFPQNCDNNCDASSTSGTRRKSRDSAEYLKKCSNTECEQPNDSHVHCHDCSEVPNFIQNIDIDF